MTAGIEKCVVYTAYHFGYCCALLSIAVLIAVVATSLRLTPPVLLFVAAGFVLEHELRVYDRN